MLLEREDILDQIDKLAGEAAAGRGRIAFVVGEAGIGKTSVLRAAAQRIGDRMRLLWSACEDLSTAEALTLLRDLAIVDRKMLDRADGSRSLLAVFCDTLALLANEPTVLLIEDLHWADEGSIDFIRYVGRRIADLPLLLIVTSRDEGQGARSRLARAASDLSPSVRFRLELARLTRAAVEELATVHGLSGSAIHEATGGNPLLVAEMLAARGERSSSIDDLVVSRASALDTAGREFLEYCSIIPRRVSLDQIIASGATDAAIEACVEAGLLLADGDGLSFRHEITRRAIEEALPPLRRALLHRRELARLNEVGASATRRLHHAIAADERPSIRDLAPLAAQQASALGAHREAVSAWAALLENDDPPFDPQQCERYAFELHLTGEIGRAIDWQGRALNIYAARDDQLRRGDGLRFLSRLLYLNGQRDLALAAGQQAIDLLAGFPKTPELALGYANLAQLGMLIDDTAGALRWSEQALAIAGQLGRDDVLATVLNNYGAALQHDDLERSLALVDQSIGLGLRSDSPEHVARAYTNKSWALMRAGRLNDALAVQSEGIDYCRERNLDTWADYMTGGYALSLLELGHWDDAQAMAEAVTVDRVNTYLVRNPAVRALALLRIRRGQEGWAELIEELRCHMALGSELPRFTSMALIVAEQAWAHGEARAEATSLLEKAASLLEINGSAWDRGKVWAWRRRLEVECPVPARLANPYMRLADGDLAGAAQIFREHGMLFEEAMALVGGNQKQVTEGLALLERLGATATVARVRRDMALRGFRHGSRGPRASTRSNEFGLTEREIAVLSAIDQGWTNKEIGQRLLVSPKTVDHHVSAILSKVGARTRGKAASLARARGLID